MVSASFSSTTTVSNSRHHARFTMQRSVGTSSPTRLDILQDSQCEHRWEHLLQLHRHYSPSDRPSQPNFPSTSSTSCHSTWSSFPQFERDMHHKAMTNFTYWECVSTGRWTQRHTTRRTPLYHSIFIPVLIACNNIYIYICCYQTSLSNIDIIAKLEVKVFKLS